MTTPIGKASDRFTETAIDDEIVVMSLESGEFFSLTGTACAIWEAIDGTRDRDAIVADLATRYSASPDAIAGDVDEFLADLRGAGLLTE
jgi:pyrroloquinoline quinone biosynthesis protein D